MTWKFWQRKPDTDFKLLGDMLSSQLAQSSLFSVPRYSQDKTLADAKGILGHSHTNGYKAWASEAWMEAVSQIKKISQSKDQREVDQAVGALRSTLHLLGVSFGAQRMVEQKADAMNAHTRAQKEVQNNARE